LRSRPDAYGPADGRSRTATPRGKAIVLDPTGSLFAAIGSGNLRAYVQGEDDVGHAALSN
jgi:hypothetical protein